MNNLNRFIKMGKDKIKKEELANVVYQINCKDCDHSYVGQIKRKLKTRLKEHINDLKKVNSYSVISNHRSDTNHVMDWDNAKILDSERSYYKRLVAEMIHIKMQKNGLNKQSDTERFPELYLPLLEKYNSSVSTFNSFSFLSPFSYPSFFLFLNINRPALVAFVFF